VTKQEFVERRKEFSGKSVDELLKLLESDDLSTRFLAEMSLRDATGT
jgi:hypothetical protein